MMDPIPPRGVEMLLKIVRAAESRLVELDPDGGAAKPGGWSRREELGHLIDSAVNNHQRVIRIPLGDTALPGYRQVEWVRMNQYANREWDDLVELWVSLNLHLWIAADALPPDAWRREASIGDDEPRTLAWIIDDYVQHLVHHLTHIGVTLNDVDGVSEYRTM